MMLPVFFEHFMELLLEYRVKSVLRSHPAESHVTL
jgi:hypothetical protein